MTTLDIVKATAPLAQYARRLKKTNPMVLTERGRPVAALVAIEDADWETVALSTSPRFLALIQRSRQRQKREGGVSASEARRRLGLEKTKRRK